MLVLLHADCKSILAYCFKHSDRHLLFVKFSYKYFNYRHWMYIVLYVIIFCITFTLEIFLIKTNVNIETTLLSFCILMTKCIKRNKTN